MESVNKFQSLVILLMVAIGILLGQIGFVQTYSEYLITPFLMVMLFLVFLQIPLKDILKSFKNLKFTLTVVIINFIWTPFLILVLGRLFLVDHPKLLIGYIMLMVTPCTDWYLIFTGISKGNVALGSSILPLNLVLRIFNWWKQCRYEYNAISKRRCINFNNSTTLCDNYKKNYNK